MTLPLAVRRRWPALSLATIAGSALLALSVVGLGDLLTVTKRLACRMAEPWLAALAVGVLRRTSSLGFRDKQGRTLT